jgi:cytosine/adenosine deaminase-related metal-dependent hydrolase
LIRYHASWVLPIEASPLRDGWVAVGGGRIVEYGSHTGAREPVYRGADDIDLGNVAILPGLVNAHTHLELSYLRDQVPAGRTFVSWIRALLSARRAYADPLAPEILAGIDAGIAEAVRCGTAAVGDIGNTLAACRALAASPLDGVVFYEVIGFNPGDPVAPVTRALDAIARAGVGGRLRASLAAHAPYSVAPGVMQAISAVLERDDLETCSIHLAESVEEVEFVRTGEGPWRELLEDLGVWNPAWAVPAVSPVQYVDEVGFLSSRVMAVHGVQMTAADLARLAAHDTTLVTCPRSNVYTGAGTPPIEQFYASGVRIAVGTDSLAITPDLNLFAELARMRALARGVPASALLDSATRQGARALGLDRELGTMTPGKRARLIGVSLPAGIEDVEEYLVSNVYPDQIAWIEA